MISILAFINKYIGQTGVGNTPQNMGECVGLTSLWQDNLGVPHEYGNAKDLLANADTSLYDVIYNDPNDQTQFPADGDQVVWDETWGNGDGHTALSINSNGTKLNTFEQNDETSQDPNGACEILQHNYDGVLGWLHFKAGYKQDVPVDSETFDELVHNSTVSDLVNDYLKLPHNSDFSVIKEALDKLHPTVVNNNQPIAETPATPADPTPPADPSETANTDSQNTPAAPAGTNTPPVTNQAPSNSGTDSDVATTLTHRERFLQFIGIIAKALRLRK